MPAVPMELRVGNASTKKKSRRTSVAVFGASTAAKLSSTIVKKTYACPHCSCKRWRGTALFPAASVKHVLHWSNYSAKSVALIQARGIPIDVPLWNLVQENKAAV